MLRVVLALAAGAALGAPAPRAPVPGEAGFEPAAATPFDRALEVDLAGGAAGAPEGPRTAGVDYAVGFEGTLHVRAEARTPLALRVESGAAELLGEAAPARHPHVSVPVTPGSVVRVTLSVEAAADPRAATLRLAAAPESPATIATADEAMAALESIRSATRAGRRDDARASVADHIARIGDVEGSAHSGRAAGALYELGRLGYEAGDAGLAVRAWTPVLRHRLRTLPPLDEDLLLTWLNLGTAIWVTGDPRGALGLLEHAHEGLAASRPADDPALLATRMNIGSIVRGAGDLPRARLLLQSALEGLERGARASERLVVDARHNLAAALSDLGDLEGARALQERALEGYERLLPADDSRLSSARLNLGFTLQQLGQREAALEMYEAVLATRVRTLPAGHPLQLSVRLNLAGLLSSLGRRDEARALLEEALAAAAALPEDTPDVLRAQSNLSDELAAAGDLDGAAELAAAVLAGLERTLPDDHRDVLLARGNLAITLLETGAGARACDLVEQNVGRLLARTLSAALLATREARTVLATDTSRVEEALFFDSLGGGPPSRALFELIETRRLVAGAGIAGAARHERDAELAPLRAAVADARAQLNDLVAPGAAAGISADDRRREIDRCSARRDAAERELRAALAGRGAGVTAVAAGEIARALPPGAAAVGFLRYAAWKHEPDSGRPRPLGDRLLAHVLDARGALARVELGSAEELEALVGAWRGALGRPLVARGLAAADAPAADPAREREHGARLRARLFDPLLAAAGPGVRTWIVCPDDLVHLVPLDALPLDEPDARVGDRHAFVTLHALSELRAAQPPAPGPASLLALGDPAYSGAEAPSTEIAALPPPTRAGEPGRFAPLPATRAEIEGVGELFRRTFGLDAVLLEGTRAGKDELLARASATRYLHLATHGWFAPESVRSVLDADTDARGSFPRMGLEERVLGFAPMSLCGLALAGADLGADALGRVAGILTAEELCSLDLSRCELAVLSACETNVGARRAGQGIQSLQTALHVAGARMAVTSLWKVDDAATRDLMVRFYALLWSEGRPAAEALWHAKRELRAAGRPPRDWAGWVLSGYARGPQDTRGR